MRSYWVVNVSSRREAMLSRPTVQSTKSNDGLTGLFSLYIKERLEF
jgi:hypothetical protein